MAPTIYTAVASLNSCVVWKERRLALPLTRMEMAIWPATHIWLRHCHLLRGISNQVFHGISKVCVFLSIMSRHRPARVHNPLPKVSSLYNRVCLFSVCNQGPEVSGFSRLLLVSGRVKSCRKRNNTFVLLNCGRWR